MVNTVKLCQQGTGKLTFLLTKLSSLVTSKRPDGLRFILYFGKVYIIGIHRFFSCTIIVD